MPRACKTVLIGHDPVGNPLYARVTVQVGRCKYCGRPEAKLCDFPVSNPKRKSKTCDAKLCVVCAVKVKPEHADKLKAAGVVLASPDSTELCPPHARLLGIGG